MKKFVMIAAAMAASMTLMAQNVYQKVTTTPEDWTGTYLIVCESQSVVFNGSASEENIDAKGGPAIIANVAIADNTITGTTDLDAATFTISSTEDTDWPWAIQSASGLYIGHKDSIVVDNGLSVELEIKGKCKHTLAIEEGNLIATPKHSVGEAFNLQYNKKTEQLRFRYFLPNDKEAIQIYKLVTPSTGIESVNGEAHAVKRFENGQLIIVKGNKKYNLLGKEL